MLNFESGVGCSASPSCDQNKNCPRNPDFCIKKNDTQPSFRVAITDCDGVVDLTDENLVLEASMWVNSKLKINMADSDTALSFADNIGFDQVNVGDIILVNRPRNPEKMLIVSIDEINKSLSVDRGYEGTVAQDWNKGTELKVFKFINAPAQIESVFSDIVSVDGSTVNELTDTFFVFNWTLPQTSLPGCFWLEFKLLKMNFSGSSSTSGIEWVKSFPLSEGFLINVLDSPVISY